MTVSDEWIRNVAETRSFLAGEYGSARTTWKLEPHADVDADAHGVVVFLKPYRNDELAEDADSANRGELAVEERRESPGIAIHIERHANTGSVTVIQRIEQAGMHGQPDLERRALNHGDQFQIERDL